MGGALSAVVRAARNTVPAVPDIAMLPSTSGVGTGAPAVPLPSPTRKWPWAGMVPLRTVVPVGLALLLDERYWTEVPARSTAAEVGL